MGLSGKKTEKNHSGAKGEAKLSAQAKKIADRVLAFQLALAAKLNAQAQRLGEFSTRVLLGAVLLGFGCYCAWLILKVLF